MDCKRKIKYLQIAMSTRCTDKEHSLSKEVILKLKGSDHIMVVLARHQALFRARYINSFNSAV